MAYTLEQIKSDLQALDVKQFYMKHIVRSDNWYFEHILSIPPHEILKAVDDFKNIVSENIGVSFNSVMMVGSGKVGYSLSPKKNFKEFNGDGEGMSKSDVDIAIISHELFNEFWNIYRKSYSIKYKSTYKHISNEIYRGYINERNLREIDNCRKKWTELSARSNKKLRSELYLKHDITYRIYRCWEDFEEYNLLSINKMKSAGGYSGI